MVDKLKRQFIHANYELNLLKEIKGLKQVGRSVQEYRKEFYQVLIRISNVKSDKEKIGCYRIGLRPIIQDEISLIQMNSIEEAY